MDRLKLDNLIAVVNGQLNPAGYDCIEAEWSPNDKILRLYVDLPEGNAGINLDGCVAASRLLGELPALDDMIPGQYVLEVSSPGVERPLRRLDHFRAHVGSKVEAKLRDKYNDRRQGKGTLAAVSDAEGGWVTLDTEQGMWSFPLGSLQKASLLYDWGDS